jgi:hypothetical protein
LRKILRKEFPNSEICCNINFEQWRD